MKCQSLKPPSDEAVKTYEARRAGGRGRGRVRATPGGAATEEKPAEDAEKVSGGAAVDFYSVLTDITDITMCALCATTSQLTMSMMRRRWRAQVLKAVSRASHSYSGLSSATPPGSWRYRQLRALSSSTYRLARRAWRTEATRMQHADT